MKNASVLLALGFMFLGCLSAEAQCYVEQTHRLVPDDGMSGGDFGISVAINGTKAIVGANNQPPDATGAAYLFYTNSGQQFAKLIADDGELDDGLGNSVSISGTRAIVGAEDDDDNGFPSSGSAYLFNTTTGQQTFKLLPNDGASHEHFGHSVSISGTTAIVGAYVHPPYGAAYLFDTTTGEQVAELLPNDAGGGFFGYCVAISGSTAIVGARYDDDNGFHSGSAYLYDTTTGQQTFKLLPNDGAPDEQFGYSVAISGNMAIVGAWADDDNGFHSGSAYLFNTTTGQQIAKLLADDGAPEDLFGNSVGISGTTAIVGALFDDAPPFFDTGSAYLFDTTTGQQCAKIHPDIVVSHNENFGYSVSISGTNAIVGTRAGAAYLFAFEPAPTQVDATLDTALMDVAPDNNFGAHTHTPVGVANNESKRRSLFYFDVADQIPEDATITNVVFEFDTTQQGGMQGQQGADYSLHRMTTEWDEGTGVGNIGEATFDGASWNDAKAGVWVAELLPTDGAAGDRFGITSAIDGTTAIVGAFFDSDNGIESGSAYVFDSLTGQQTTKLLPNDGAAGERFGYSVAVSGTTAIVGAYFDNDNGNNSGSAYLFDTVTGTQIAKLLPTDGAEGDQFGVSVDIDGNTAIVGALFDDDNGASSGAAYLFDVTTGTQIAKLLPSDGALGDTFGFSVGISGTTAIIGASRDDDNGNDSGSAYLFDITTGIEIAKLLPTDGAANDRFGFAVAIDGLTAVVGAYHDDDNGTDSGSAYLFDIPTSTQFAKLLPNGAAGDLFGFSVSISGTMAFVGAPLANDNGVDSGTAYLFDTTTGQQTEKLLPNDGVAGNTFGRSVAIDGLTGIIGAEFADDNGIDSGAAYVYDAKVPWNTPGGDFDASSLGTVFVDAPDGALGFRISSPELNAVVQDMLDNPASNYGFMLKNVDEGLLGSASRVTSREGADGSSAGARLLISYRVPTVVPASEYNLIRGVLVEGDLADTFSSDDMRMRFNPGFTLNSMEAPVWIIFDAILSTDSPNSLILQIEAQAGTPGLTATTEAWNWNTSTFDVVDVSATSFNNDTVITPSLTPGDHVQSGTAAVHSRLGWRKTGFTINYPWETRLDQFVWVEE